MSIRWVVWAEHVVGWVEGPTKGIAYARAVRQHGDTVTRVESEISYTVGDEERRARERNQRLHLRDEEDGA